MSLWKGTIQRTRVFFKTFGTFQEVIPGLQTNQIKLTESKLAAITGVFHLHLPECSLSANPTNSHYLPIFMHFFLMKSGGNTCVIFNCANSSIKIKLWKKKECETHKASTARRMPLFLGYSE